MQVIDLDETGIKLISAKKQQMYLSVKEVQDFLSHKYQLNENVLQINTKAIELSETELEGFDAIYEHINRMYTKG